MHPVLGQTNPCSVVDVRVTRRACDWLNEHYEVRKTARAGEVESLKNAKAVLAGADYSLVQLNDKTTRRHLRG